MCLSELSARTRYHSYEVEEVSSADLGTKGFSLFLLPINAWARWRPEPQSLGKIRAN